MKSSRKRKTPSKATPPETPAQVNIKRRFALTPEGYPTHYKNRFGVWVPISVINGYGLLKIRERLDTVESCPKLLQVIDSEITIRRERGEIKEQ